MDEIEAIKLEVEKILDMHMSVSINPLKKVVY